MKEITENFCNFCNRSTNHTTLFSHREYYIDDAAKWEDFQTIRCNGCNNVSFRIISNYGHDQQGNISYPPRHKIKQGISIFYIPHNIYNLYKEVHESINNNFSILLIIGIRTLIEIVYNNIINKGHAACRKNLDEKINDLYNEGFICKNDKNILHKIRIAGNKSAHKGSEFNTEHIATALSIIENIIKSIYVHPKKTHSQEWLNT